MIDTITTTDTKIMTYPNDYINKVICGDCLEVMKGIPNDSVDLVLTDPPYGANKKFDNDKIKNIENNIKNWSIELIRVCKNQLFIFCDFRTIEYWLRELKDLIFRNIILWHKELGGSSPKYYARKTEYILWFVKDKNNYFFNPIEIKCSSNKCRRDFKNITDLWLIPSINNMAYERVKHPAQKPLELMLRIIKSHSRKNDLILDPFLGSGTTAVACKQLNRKYIGIEINPDYCRIARERLMGIPNSLFKEKND